MSLDRLLEATASVRREAFRRDAGEERDPRFDIPIAMLLDLADDLDPVEIDRLVERLHGEPEMESLLGVGYAAAEDAGFAPESERALLDDCTNDLACEADQHLSTCPRRGR